MFAIVKLENLTCGLHHTQKEGKEFSNQILYDHERDARFRIQHVNTKFLLSQYSFYTRISLRFNSTTGSSRLTVLKSLWIILHLFCKEGNVLKLHITIFCLQLSFSSLSLFSTRPSFLFHISLTKTYCSHTILRFVLPVVSLYLQQVHCS